MLSDESRSVRQVGPLCHISHCTRPDRGCGGGLIDSRPRSKTSFVRERQVIDPRPPPAWCLRTRRARLTTPRQQSRRATRRDRRRRDSIPGLARYYHASSGSLRVLSLLIDRRSSPGGGREGDAPRPSPLDVESGAPDQANVPAGEGGAGEAPHAHVHTLPGSNSRRRHCVARCPWVELCRGWMLYAVELPDISQRARATP